MSYHTGGFAQADGLVEALQPDVAGRWRYRTAGLLAAEAIRTRPGGGLVSTRQICTAADTGKTTARTGVRGRWSFTLARGVGRRFTGTPVFPGAICRTAAAIRGTGVDAVIASDGLSHPAPAAC